MKGSASTKGLFSVRSLIFIGVLLTLCVSEGVGLQLLPFPSKPDEQGLSAKFTRIESFARSTPAPIQDEHKLGRLEIAAPKPEQLLAQQHIINAAALALATANDFQDSSLLGIHPEQAARVYSLVLACQPATRAPPTSAGH